MFIRKRSSYPILKVEWEGERLISMQELSFRCELHPEVIEHYVVLDLISPIKYGKKGYLFRESAVDEIRIIQRLRRDLGVNLISAGIILDLLDEIDELKKEVSRLRKMR
ncbi:MAG: chaperone-modulator protein CbpM [Candidatus Methanolliviera sp. GoM_asphalt]|nr:MAG: chaperone-modulator protein CbpM [Candidatus Methanolliviera sp. GoM_asphalt]